AFVLYPGAELLDMLDYNATTCAQYTAGDSRNLTAPCNDGTHTLEPNSVVWTPGDSVENAHHYAGLFGSGHHSLQVFNPINLSSHGRWLALMGTTGGGAVTNPAGNYAADKITNYVAASNHAYHGGTRTPPGGYALDNGLFNYGLFMQYAPDPVGASMLYAGCPLSGCSDVAFWYNLFTLVGNGGSATLQYTPNTRSFALNAAWLDLNNAPLMSPKIQGRANGTAAALVFNSYDNGAALHSWTISAPASGGGYTLTLPQKSGT